MPQSAPFRHLDPSARPPTVSPMLVVKVGAKDIGDQSRSLRFETRPLVLCDHAGGARPVASDPALPMAARR